MKMRLKTFVKYLQENKGFVVVDGQLYRHNSDYSDIVKYHVEDIGYKYSRYRNESITPEILTWILAEIDIDGVVEKHQRLIRGLILVKYS